MDVVLGVNFPANSMDRFELNALSSGFNRVAGVDEAGRGPLAGPVVAAAVVYSPRLSKLGVKDSKKLTPARRQALAPMILAAVPAVGLGLVWPEQIDSMNIHFASLKAMEDAVRAISSPPPDFLLVDGKFPIENLLAEQSPVVSGDCLCVSIAAASIIAKTTRDSIMLSFDRIYPGYGFKRNKGYCTREHVSALDSIGPSPIHRKSFSYSYPGVRPVPDRGRS